MKLRYLAPVWVSLALLSLLILLIFWRKSPQEEPIAMDSPINAGTSPGSSAANAWEGKDTLNTTSGNSGPTTGNTPDRGGDTPHSGPMEANAGDLEPVYKKDFKYPHLLKVRGAEPEVLFVANQLLALPENEGVREAMQMWVDERDWIRLKEITRTALLFTWEGHDAERFVEVREFLQQAFGPGAQFEPNTIIHAMVSPNDPSYPLQSHLGSIEAEGGWEFGTDAGGLIIAVLDSGVDLGHEDLVDAIYVNPGEIPGNGIDDDGNGWIDDVSGWDFYEDDADASDGDGHGTHIAGLIAATANNGKGITGLAWNARILPVRFLDENGDGNRADLLQALDYLDAVGVDIVNASFGSYSYSNLERIAFRKLSEAGVWIACSSGNDALSTDAYPHYPSGYDLPFILSVGSSNARNQKSSFSNYGRDSVDLFAPGSQLYSTFPGNTYGYGSGTSQATALVSAALALFKANNPDISAFEERKAFLGRSQFFAGFEDYCQTSSILNLRTLLDPQAVNPPVITLQPEAVFVSVGDTAVLNFDFESSSQASILWHNLSGAIHGASGKTLSIAGATVEDSSVYWAVVENAFGATRTREVTVSVDAESPAIVGTTSAASILGGLPMQLQVNATGSPPLSYQWFKDNAAIPEATGSSYSVGNTSAADAGVYYVEVSNPWGSVRSSDIPVTAAAEKVLDWKYVTGEEYAGISYSNGYFFQGSYSRSTYHISKDFFNWTELNLSGRDTVKYGPWFISEKFCYLGNDNQFYTSENGITWSGNAVALQSSLDIVAVPFPKGVLFANADTFYYVDVDTESVNSYPNPGKQTPPPLEPSLDPPGLNAFNGGADLITEEGVTLHSSDGVNWIHAGAGLPVRVAIDDKTGLYVGYENEPTSKLFQFSEDGLVWAPVWEAYYPAAKHITGYIQKDGYRFDLETREWIGGYRPIQYTNGEFIFYKPIGDLQSFQMSPEAPLQTIETVSYDYAIGSFYVSHGEVYSTTYNGIYHWRPGEMPVQVRFQSKTLYRANYLGDHNGSAILREENDYYRQDVDGNLHQIFPPGFIANLRKSDLTRKGDVFCASVGDGNVWTSTDMENWIHEVGFPGFSVYGSNNHLIGVFQNYETGHYELYKKNYAESLWEKVSGFPVDATQSVDLSVYSGGFAAKIAGGGFTSADGRTWTQIDFPVDRIQIINNELYVDSNGFFFRAQGDGEAWESVPRLPAQVYEGDLIAAKDNAALARRDGYTYRGPPGFLKKEPGSEVYAPGVHEFACIADDPGEVVRIDVFLNGAFHSSLENGENTFYLEVSEPGIASIQFEVIYGDGWRALSVEKDVVTGIPLTELSSGWIGTASSSRPFPGIVVYSNEFALYAVDRNNGDLYSTTNGVDWDLIFRIKSSPNPLFYEPTPGFLAISFINPLIGTMGTVRDPGTRLWKDISNPNNETFITYAFFTWNERLFVLFSDGKIYEINSDGDTLFHGTIAIPEEVYVDDMYPFNVPLQIDAGNSLVLIRINGFKFITDDLSTIHPFTTPEGWRLTTGLSLLSEDNRRTAEITDLQGTAGNIRELSVGPLETMREPFAGWFIGTGEGYTWIGNEYGRFFPLADTSTPTGMIWRKDNVIVLLSSQGNFRTVSAYEFEGKRLQVGSGRPMSGSVITGKIHLANYGILTPSSSETLNCRVTLKSVDVDSLSFDLGLVEVDLSRSIPSLVTPYDIEFVMPEGLQLGDYFVELELDADDRFPEADEENNTIGSNVFAYDPNVSLVSFSRSGGLVESNEWNSSLSIGTEVELAAQPSPGYAFLEWSGDVESTSSTLQVTMDASKFIEAHFVPAWLLVGRRDLYWMGLEGWHRTKAGPGIHATDLHAAYDEAIGWILNVGRLDGVTWNPDFGWMAKVTDTEVYYLFDGSGWLVYEAHEGGYYHVENGDRP